MPFGFIHVCAIQGKCHSVRIFFIASTQLELKKDYGAASLSIVPHGLKNPADEKLYQWGSSIRGQKKKNDFDDEVESIIVLFIHWTTLFFKIMQQKIFRIEFAYQV
jgi:hypothetical protein